MVFTGCNMVDPCQNNSKILTEIRGSTATIWLNRPEKQNAMDIEMISGFLAAMQNLNSVPDIRIIVIRGKGQSFCAGADLNWMQRSSLLSEDENLSECAALARCFYEIHNSSKITLCLVHGVSYGGANGFAAASDMAFADNATVFAFSEVRMGLIPATIAPYVIHKTGQTRAMELMLTGKKFTAEEAEHWRLINKAIPAGMMDAYVDEVICELLEGAPLVQRVIKTYLNASGKLEIKDEIIGLTAGLLAKTRIGMEAKEGINAFLQKRKPVWYRENS